MVTYIDAIDHNKSIPRGGVQKRKVFRQDAPVILGLDTQVVTDIWKIGGGFSEDIECGDVRSQFCTTTSNS